MQKVMFSSEKLKVPLERFGLKYNFLQVFKIFVYLEVLIYIFKKYKRKNEKKLCITLKDLSK